MLPSTSTKRLFLLSQPLLLETCFPSMWSPPFPLDTPALISPISRQGAALSHLGSLPPHGLLIRTDISVPCYFGKGGSGVLANCSLCGTEATLPFPAGSVRSSFSAEACAILQALCWSQHHQQVCHFSSLLLLSDSRSFLAILSFLPSFLLS